MITSSCLMAKDCSAELSPLPEEEGKEGEEEERGAGGRRGSSRRVRVSCPITSPEGEEDRAASASSLLKPSFTRDSTRCSTFQSALLTTCELQNPDTGREGRLINIKHQKFKHKKHPSTQNILKKKKIRKMKNPTNQKEKNKSPQMKLIV